jgi:hypothetical protein
MTRRQTLHGLGLIVVAAAACSYRDNKHPAAKVEAPLRPIGAGDYLDGPDGLSSLWRDILRAAQKDQREQVLHLLASLAMSRAELDRLFGPAQAAVLWPRYQSMISDLVHMGGLELVDTIHNSHFDQIEVLPYADRPPAELSPSEQRVQKALKATTPLYTIRLFRSAEPPPVTRSGTDGGKQAKRDRPLTAIRYEFFVYLDGRWRTGSLLGQQLQEPPPEGR